MDRLAVSKSIVHAIADEAGLFTLRFQFTD